MVRTYEEILSEMDAPTRTLFLRIVENHLANLEQDPEFHVMDVASGVVVQPSEGTLNTEGMTKNRIADLIEWGFLRQLRFGRNGRGFTVAVKPIAINFYRYLSESDAGAPEATEARATREASAGSTFANAHPDAAEHLREANLLLSSNDAALTIVNEVGGHLRSAIHAVSSAVLDDETVGPEHSLAEIVKRTAGSHFHADPAAAKLAAFAEEVLREAQRLDHVRDEEHRDRPFQGWEEMRRAVTLATVACTELALLQGKV